MTILPLFDSKETTSSYVPNYSQQPTKRQKANVNMALDGYMFNEEMRFVRKIGAGTYGLIYLVENIYTKKQFAAKMVLKQQPMNFGAQSPSSPSSSSNKQLIQQQFYQYFLNHVIPRPKSIDFDYIKGQGHDCQFLTEIALHLKVHDHPNVVTIHEVYELENFAIVILLDYFDQGDLFGNIIDAQIFQHKRCDREKQLLMKNAMLQLIDAVEYCQQNSVYHCDLKPENIMVKYNKGYKRPHSQHYSNIIDYNELHLVLIDFGLAMESDTVCCNACRGSSFYMAPERTTNFNTSKLIRSLVDMSQFQTVQPASSSVSSNTSASALSSSTTINESNSKYLPTLAGDIWSLGVLFINITCSRNPWPIASFNDANSEVFINYMLHNKKDILSSILPISAQFNRLLDSIFQLNPNDRIDLHTLYKEIIRCNFFKNDHHHVKKTQVERSANQQLYTPPDTTAYNSYASDMEEDEFDEEEEEDEDEDYYTDAEEFDEVEESINVQNGNNNVLLHQLTPESEPEDLPVKQQQQQQQAYLQQNHQALRKCPLQDAFLRDAKSYAKKLCTTARALPQFAIGTQGNGNAIY
ncbi:SKS1 [Candida margitis]|uniref:SKS1 n=1 Tax=Candida margitis TaxID=1775924 RepID=UPI002227314E|nr:SKS1 [Candida margitis]KAI5949666.1 SKS1 [Candida margitis]